jgi:hypothetical protein
MERMLHRGKYCREGEAFILPKLTWRNALIRLVGIDSQYTRGDKAIAWSVFIYCFGWRLLCGFVAIVIWNAISPWPKSWWPGLHFILAVVVPGIIAVISTVWFSIGGTWDLWRLFKRLAAKESNVLDDGRVVGHVSADDVAMVENVDHVVIEEAHVEEKELQEALEREHDEEDINKLKEETGDA